MELNDVDTPSVENPLLAIVDIESKKALVDVAGILIGWIFLTAGFFIFIAFTFGTLALSYTMVFLGTFTIFSFVLRYRKHMNKAARALNQAEEE